MANGNTVSDRAARQKLAAAEARLQAVLQPALNRGAAILARDLKLAAPKGATSVLANSTQIKALGNIRQVHAGAAHAIDVVRGHNGGRASPVRELERWVIAKRLKSVAYASPRSIAEAIRSKHYKQGRDGNDYPRRVANAQRAPLTAMLMAAARQGQAAAGRL